MYTVHLLAKPTVHDTCGEALHFRVRRRPFPTGADQMRTALRAAALALMVCLGAGTAVAQEELDDSKHKLQLNAWVSAPTGYFNGTHKEDYFDLQRDFGFGNYITFNGRLDWRFKRKHHLLFSATPVVSSRTTTINRTIDWQGQTFNAGGTVESTIRSLIFAPGYQWDFLRRRSIWVGLLVNVNLLCTDARLKATAKLSGSGGSTTAGTQADGSLFVPLPALGPDFRWYPIPSSGRFYLEGALTGMSFFGYGNFVSSNAALGLRIGHHWDARAGYLLGSRFKIYGSSNNIGIRLTQKGPVFGLEYTAQTPISSTNVNKSRYHHLFLIA